MLEGNVSSNLSGTALCTAHEMIFPETTSDEDLQTEPGATRLVFVDD